MKTKNITIVEGDTYDLSFTLKRKDGTPFNLSDEGSEVRALVLNPAGSQIIREFEIRLTDPANGKFTIHLSAPATSFLHGKYKWIVKFQDATRVVTLLGGELTATRVI